MANYIDSPISVTQAQDAINKAHEHINLLVLSKFGEKDGRLTYNGQPIPRFYSTDTEPEDWADGDLWLAPVDENIPVPIEVATIPFDSTKPFHLELDDITETLLNTTDNEQSATENDLIII